MEESCKKPLHPPSVSVIVITLGRSKIFQECLYSLLTQTYDNYEVIIVSDDPQLKLPEDLYLKDNVKIIYNKRRIGIGKARNIGIKSSHGEIVAFIDDDAIPEYDWITKLIKCFNEGADAVFGKVVPRSSNLSKPIKLLSELYSSMVGCNMAFQKDALIKVGLFNEKIDYGGDEDEIVSRLIKHGYKVKICKYAIVKHDFSKNYVNLFWKTYKGGLNAHLLKEYKRAPILSRRKLIKTLLIQKEFNTFIIFLLLFIIRRIGILVGKIRFWKLY
ncbi:MAG: glycosyltransferase [Candidatus Bathyarchaeia archaeon]